MTGPAEITERCGLFVWFPIGFLARSRVMAVHYIFPVAAW